MKYDHLKNRVIDKNDPDFAAIPQTLEGEIFVDGDEEMGWVTKPNLTPQQEAEQAAERARRNTPDGKIDDALNANPVLKAIFEAIEESDPSLRAKVRAKL